MRNILITGGAGFIGSHLALRLIDKGYNVTVLDNLSEQIHGVDPKKTSVLYCSIKNKVNFIEGSITNRSDVEEALYMQDAVIHLASETGTGQSMYEIHRYSNVNVSGTALILDVLANTENKVKKMLVASSRSIYGEGKYLDKDNLAVYPCHRKTEDLDKGDFEVYISDSKERLKVAATDEKSKIHPSSVYGITKQCQEQLIMTVCPTLGIAPVAFRYQNVYGPGQSLTNPYTGILSIFSTLIRNRGPINIFEDGKESRDFVFIDDVVNATVLGLTKEESNGEVFNVGTGLPINVLKIAETLVEKYGIQVPINISGNYRLGDIRHNYADIAKIKRILGFSPQYDFERGISLFVEWVNSQMVVESKFDNSINEMKKKGLLK